MLNYFRILLYKDCTRYYCNQEQKIKYSCFEQVKNGQFGRATIYSWNMLCNDSADLRGFMYQQHNEKTPWTRLNSFIIMTCQLIYYEITQKKNFRFADGK
ncbi:Hypothetical_protein [Hexamita inflata]|uniref:Hypothetical_protein n=1 Tax=Hexamita inflata TaxID=28002 RepID=A0AA86NR52_9EUKA|nr:Hypothetical protein HINF_LOCUS12130 [Hexamita inflata]